MEFLFVPCVNFFMFILFGSAAIAVGYTWTRWIQK